MKYIIGLIFLLLLTGCEKKVVPDPNAVKPILTTETTKKDTDDPAIWIHPTDRSKSLILGTDKAGYLFVFNLEGEIIKAVHDPDMMRLNNVDIEYGFELNGEIIDIAIASDRDAHKIYALSMPDLERIDNGDFFPFEGEEDPRPMGIALYKRPTDESLFLTASRKFGPSGSYLWQFLVEDDGNGKVKFTKVREFGNFSGVTEDGSGEIEALVIDDEMGFLYCSDELYGVRKYYADPDAKDANVELAAFGTDGFKDDREGISIYKTGDKTGYIIVSDQQANKFRVFTREGTPDNPHQHNFVTSVSVSTNGSDGSEVTNLTLNDNFPGGLFIAMSDDKTFQLYSWKDIAGDKLTIVNK